MFRVASRVVVHDTRNFDSHEKKEETEEEEEYGDRVGHEIFLSISAVIFGKHHYHTGQVVVLQAVHILRIGYKSVKILNLHNDGGQYFRWGLTKSDKSKLLYIVPLNVVIGICINILSEKLHENSNLYFWT